MRIITKQTERSISRGNLNLERYLKNIEKFSTLNKEDEKEIIQKAQKGDQRARDQIVLANIKFVVTCAKQYQAPNIEILDLISAGNIGLINAIDKFDTTTSTVKFYSYAVWWIRQAMISFLKDHSRSIKVPYNQQDTINNLTKKRDELEKKLEMEISLIDTIYFTEGESETKEDTTLLKQAIEGYAHTLSLDQPMGTEEDDMPLGETLGTEPGFDLDLDKNHLKVVVGKALETLNPTQQRVLRLAYGLDDGVCYANDDIAEMLDVTSERIRQIKQKALLKLKADKSLKKAS